MRQAEYKKRGRKIQKLALEAARKANEVKEPEPGAYVFPYRYLILAIKEVAGMHPKTVSQWRQHLKEWGMENMVYAADLEMVE